MGYIVSLSITGIPDWRYLIPLKAMGLITALIFGNQFYYITEEKEIIFSASFRTLKYVLVAIVLLIVLSEFEQYLFEVKGIDVGYIIGFFDKESN